MVSAAVEGFSKMGLVKWRPCPTPSAEDGLPKPPAQVGHGLDGDALGHAPLGRDAAAGGHVSGSVPITGLHLATARPAAVRSWEGRQRVKCPETRS